MSMLGTILSSVLRLYSSASSSTTSLRKYWRLFTLGEKWFDQPKFSVFYYSSFTVFFPHSFQFHWLIVFWDCPMPLFSILIHYSKPVFDCQYFIIIFNFKLSYLNTKLPIASRNSNSIFQIPFSKFHITNSTFQIPYSKFHIPISKFQIPYSIFQFPNSIFHIPYCKFYISKVGILQLSVEHHGHNCHSCLPLHKW